MAGPQHTFPTGFPNPQQGPMRNQFGAGPQMAGLMASSQQAVMVGQQAYGVGMQPNAQQALAQQQQQQTQQLQIQQQQQQIQLQQQQHLQQLQQQQQQQQQQTQQLQIQQQQQQIQLQQQQHLQQLQQQQQAAVQQQIQQQQQVAAVQGAQQAQVGVGGQQPQQQVPQQPAQSKEINTASLCRFGQETVQDIVARTQEVFVALKTSQPPNGTAQGTNSSAEKKAKLQEQIRNVRILFKRLRLIYDKCNENCQGMEYTHIESLIPLKEEWDMKSDEKKTSESYRLACDENKEIMEQVILKNRHLKEIIDHLRRIIWEINTMLTMRRS